MATKPRNRQAEILAEWKQTSTATAAHLDKLQHLNAQRTALENFHDEFQRLSAEQDTLAAARQEVSKRMQEILAAGNRTAAFLRAGARQHFGPDSEKLVEFGIRPFRSRRRKTTEPEPPSETPNPNIE
jgi:chromosome segregation ATPase